MEKSKGFVGVRREEENRGEWVGQRSEEGEGSVEEEVADTSHMHMYMYRYLFICVHSGLFCFWLWISMRHSESVRNLIQFWF